jgi:mono/diheme cytochrome c family protein
MSPWSPIMDAGTALATPVAYVQARTPLQLQGALVIQNKQCRNCHRLGGEGGSRAPALDGVATRFTRDQLIRQVLQGGGNMPAYGKNLAPAEVTRSSRFWRPSARRINRRRARQSRRDLRRGRAIYLGGWRELARPTPRFGRGRLAAFLGGLGALAVASPRDALARQLLQAHMTQHMLLMMVAPPLLWLGAPSPRCCVGSRAQSGARWPPGSRLHPCGGSRTRELAGSRSPSRSGAGIRLGSTALSRSGRGGTERASSDHSRRSPRKRRRKRKRLMKSR